jgi:serine/threonine protein kinase
LLKAGSLIAHKYEIAHLIAEGGMAELYLAKCLTKDDVHEFVAIKRLKPVFRNIKSHVELFQREAYYIITLNSPLVVKGLELISEGSELFLVMEYILGSHISHVSYLLKKQRLNLRVKLAVLVGMAIARALKVIRDWPDKDGQTLDLVHGDISGQNIILSIDGTIKLVDFGVATTASKQQVSENQILGGTRRYMSPEQRQGKFLTQASDIYSLALVLEEIIQEKLGSHGLSHIISKAKACDLRLRYSDADELLDDLEALWLKWSGEDPQFFLCHIFENHIQTQGRKLLLMARLVSLTGALALIGALVVATGTHYFYPQIPERGLQDHHCENYGEDLVMSAHNL